EVTFDIDANGILNVSATDKATGKEQAIRISAVAALSDEQIKDIMARNLWPSHFESSSDISENPSEALSESEPAKPWKQPAVFLKPEVKNRTRQRRKYFLSYAREDELWATKVQKSL